MQVLLTELEDYPSEEYISKLMQSFPSMLVQSSEWLVTIIMRMFNNKKCIEIFKKNMKLAPKSSIIKLFDLIAKESPSYEELCFELKKETLPRSKKV